MSYIAGYGIHDKNIVFRFCLYIFSGFAVFAVILSWRAQLMFNSEYQEVIVFKKHKQTNAQVQKIELEGQLNNQ